VRPFAFIEPISLDDVIRLLAAGPDQARLIAGGSDLLGELKDDVVRYERLISLAGIDELRHIGEEGGGLRLGALATVAQLEYDPHLDGAYRLLAEAARSVATPEIRAQGTLGAIPPATRCLYYRHALTPCLKRGALSRGRQPVSSLPVHYGWPGLLQCARLGPRTAPDGAWGTSVHCWHGWGAHVAS
jgi:xanthine dehydrogenase YagS FAD-binding subunit